MTIPVTGMLDWAGLNYEQKRELRGFALDFADPNPGTFHHVSDLMFAIEGARQNGLFAFVDEGNRLNFDKDQPNLALLLAGSAKRDDGSWLLRTFPPVQDEEFLQRLLVAAVQSYAKAHRFLQIHDTHSALVNCNVRRMHIETIMDHIAEHAPETSLTAAQETVRANNLDQYHGRAIGSLQGGPSRPAHDTHTAALTRRND